MSAFVTLIRRVPVLALLLSAFWALPVHAQAPYPNRPIKLMVGVPAGGSVDLVARAFAQRARTLLGQELIVLNQPGASGTISVQTVVHAAPDGYTLAVNPSAFLTNSPYFIPKMDTNILESTTQLGTLARMRVGFVVNSKSPYRTLDDFIEDARRNPGKLSIGTPGPGSSLAVVWKAIMLERKLDINLVNFTGDVPMITAVLGEHVTASFPSAGGFGQYVRGGNLRILASMESDRLEEAPQAQTLTEFGFPFASNMVIHVYGPKGLPPEISKQLIEVINQVAAMPDYIEIVTGSGLAARVRPSGPTLHRQLQEDLKQMGQFLAKAPK